MEIITASMIGVIIALLLVIIWGDNNQRLQIKQILSLEERVNALESGENL